MKINKYISVSEPIATFVTLQHLQDKDRDGLISYDEFCDKKTKTEIAFEVISLFNQQCNKLTFYAFRGKYLHTTYKDNHFISHTTYFISHTT